MTVERMLVAFLFAMVIIFGLATWQSLPRPPEPREPAGESSPREYKMISQPVLAGWALTTVN
jgi:hypothetical protein